MLTEHGEVVSPVSKVVGRIGSTTFTIKANSGYKLDGATVSCTGGSYNETTGVLTVLNVTSARTCTVTLAQDKTTFTMNSTTDPDKINDISGPCYIIAHAYGTNQGIKNDWNNKTIYNGKTYSNCTIHSYTVSCGERCSIKNLIASELWLISNGAWNVRRVVPEDDATYINKATCSVTLLCDPL